MNHDISRTTREIVKLAERAIYMGKALGLILVKFHTYDKRYLLTKFHCRFKVMIVFVIQKTQYIVKNQYISDYSGCRTHDFRTRVYSLDGVPEHEISTCMLI